MFLLKMLAIEWGLAIVLLLTNVIVPGSFGFLKYVNMTGLKKKK